MSLKGELTSKVENILDELEEMLGNKSRAKKGTKKIVFAELDEIDDLVRDNSKDMSFADFIIKYDEFNVLCNKVFPEFWQPSIKTALEMAIDKAYELTAILEAVETTKRIVLEPTGQSGKLRKYTSDIETVAGIVSGLKEIFKSGKPESITAVISTYDADQLQKIVYGFDKYINRLPRTDDFKAIKRELGNVSTDLASIFNTLKNVKRGTPAVEIADKIRGILNDITYTLSSMTEELKRHPEVRAYLISGEGGLLDAKNPVFGKTMGVKFPRVNGKEAMADITEQIQFKLKELVNGVQTPELFDWGRLIELIGELNDVDYSSSDEEYQEIDDITRTANGLRSLCEDAKLAVKQKRSDDLGEIFNEISEGYKDGVYENIVFEE